MNEYCKYMQKIRLDEARKEKIFRLMHEKAASRAVNPERRNAGRGKFAALAVAAVALFFVGFSTASALWLSKSYAGNSFVDLATGDSASAGAPATEMYYGSACYSVIEIDGIKYIIASYATKPGDQSSYLSELAAVLINRSDEENYLSEGLSYPCVVVEDGQYNPYDENNRFYLYGYMNYSTRDVLAVCYTVGGGCDFWYINAEKYLNGEFDGDKWSVSSKALDALKEGK